MSRKVLLVDVDVSSQEQCARVLRDCACEVSAVDSGAAALALLGSRRFDAVLVDFRLASRGESDLPTAAQPRATGNQHHSHGGRDGQRPTPSAPAIARISAADQAAEDRRTGAGVGGPAGGRAPVRRRKLPRRAAAGFRQSSRAWSGSRSG